MSLHLFNASILAGWLMLVLGVGLVWSWPVALVVGGALTLGITLTLARAFGLRAKPAKE